jgi:putative SOS response-associated peptidase YedK
VAGVVPGQTARRHTYIRLQGGELFAFAGLYTRDPDGTPTCAIITTTPNALMAPIHARMPVILHPEHEGRWLDPATTDPAAALACLQPYPAELMEA